MQETNRSAREPVYKVVLLGEPNVGKTSIFYRIRNGDFYDSTPPSTGIDSCSVAIAAGDQNVLLSMWDTAGTEKFRTLTQNYYRNTHAAALVYSLDNRHSFDALRHWIEDVNRYAPAALKFLVGNKLDLGKAEVGEDLVSQFAAVFDVDMEATISAKTGEGIENALTALAEVLLKEFKTEDIGSKAIRLKHGDSQRGNCSC